LKYGNVNEYPNQEFPFNGNGNREEIIVEVGQGKKYSLFPLMLKGEARK